jgi:dihydrofolate reductase
MKPVLTFVAAVDENGLLGNEAGLPWDLPREKAHFRSYTKDKWLLLGRRTYEEMRGWFRGGHMPLVLTSRCGWDPEVGRIVSSVPHALALAEAAGQPELVCIGGGATFAAALPYADRLVLTIVHHRFAPDAHSACFPSWNEADWRETQREEFSADSEHPYAYTIRWLEKQ